MVIANLYQKRKQYIVYERRVCDGKNYRNSNSGFSIGFFWGNGECIEHHHSMSSYAKKLLEVLLLTTYRQQLVAMVVQELCCCYSSLSSSIHWRNFFLLVKMSIVDSVLKKNSYSYHWILPFSSNSVQEA